MPQYRIMVHWVQTFIFNHLKLEHHVQICPASRQVKTKCVWWNVTAQIDWLVGRQEAQISYYVTLISQDKPCWRVMMFLVEQFSNLENQVFQLQGSIACFLCSFVYLLCLDFSLSLFLSARLSCQGLHLMYVRMCMWWDSDEKRKQARLLRKEKDREKAEPDDRGDVWWHLISLITDMHLGKSTDAQIQKRGGKQQEWVGGNRTR